MHINNAAVTFAKRVAGVIWSSDRLVDDLQTTLAILADMECSYDVDRERIDRLPLSGITKAHLRQEREYRLRDEREPHLRRLADLQCRTWMLLGGRVR
jgi:hypothetical protein